ncbi:MAG: putative mRNA 3-end processing factor, partial [Limisphaerales bacterium]
WDGLNKAIKATGAHTVLATHGYSEAFSRWCISQGLQAGVLETEFVGEQAELAVDAKIIENMDSEEFTDKSEKPS